MTRKFSINFQQLENSFLVEKNDLLIVSGDTFDSYHYYANIFSEIVKSNFFLFDRNHYISR